MWGGGVCGLACVCVCVEEGGGCVSGYAGLLVCVCVFVCVCLPVPPPPVVRKTSTSVFPTKPVRAQHSSAQNRSHSAIPDRSRHQRAYRPQRGKRLAIEPQTFPGDCELRRLSENGLSGLTGIGYRLDNSHLSVFIVVFYTDFYISPVPLCLFVSVCV